MKIIKLIKKIILGVVLLIGSSIILNKLGYNLPINLFTIIISCIFKVPGIILLLLLGR